MLNLLAGHPEAAVRLLRQAQARKPDDPRILNDLAAALLAAGEITRDPWTVIEAAELAQLSWRSKPSLSALFNEALALEGLGLRTRAVAAWQRYLTWDDRSSWAEEAAQRSDRLEREILAGRARSGFFAAPVIDPAAAARNPWAARQFAEWRLLARWGEKTLLGQQAGAEAALARTEAIASVLSAGGGRLLTASIATIREAERTEDRLRLDRLARGHRAFGEAFTLAREEQAEVARALVESSIADLQAARSPFELRARVLRAWLATEPGWAELRFLVRAAEEARLPLPSIAAETRRIQAYRLTLEGRLEAAVDVYRDARRRFEVLGEREMSSTVAAMTAELLGLLGREEGSAAELAAALAAAPGMADPWNRYSVYVVAASGAAGRFGRAAVELRLEAADACRDLPERPLCRVDSWLRVAALTPDAEAAEDALRQAGELLPQAPESDGAVQTRIDLATSQARWLAGDGRSQDDWERAAELYAGAAASYESRGRAVSAARARAARAEVLRRLGRGEEAAAEYRAGLRAFRLWDQTDRFRPERAEKRSPRDLREVYEALLRLELDAAGDEPSPAAFLLSEEMRDRLAPRRSADLWLPGPDELELFTSQIPRGTAVVEYAIAGERTVAWLLAGGRLDQVVLAPREELGERVQSLARVRDLETWKSTSGALFQDLLAPVLDRLPAGTERLVLIPDSELHALPFRALWDPDSGRYVDESFRLVFAPSVRQLVKFAEERYVDPGETPRVLSLGFSSFPEDLGLDSLPQATRESEAVRAVYGSPDPGDCQVSDWAGFRRCAPLAGVIHLATHATADLLRSERSWLAFERETVPLERLWRELPDLPRRPLVVMSACQSVATAGGGEGLGGLARPFLASGARAVVGTLWRIGDRDAASLFPLFHQAFQESGDAAEALRRAREGLDRWREKPWVWGGVEVVSAGF